AALRALRPITLPSDSLTPPILWTPEGKVLGTLQLEQASDIERFRSTLPELGASGDSVHISKVTAINGHGSVWQSVQIRKDGRLIGFLAQERRFTASPQTLQPFRDLIGEGIEFYIRNATDDVWVQLSGETVPTPTNAKRFGDSLEVLTTGG